ncbi:hypothetical protein K440DRAFT_641433 [Wilcoxina mikolae CBS 423.85]|nr:hypothetical protein K440DRAFT_641433 [Wilcoxina mikolae CBS 423.85]
MFVVHRNPLPMVDLPQTLSLLHPHPANHPTHLHGHHRNLYIFNLPNKIIHMNLLLSSSPLSTSATPENTDLHAVDKRLTTLFSAPTVNFEIALANYDRPPSQPYQACIQGFAPESIMFEIPECIIDQATVELDPEYRAALVLPPLRFRSGLAKIIYIEEHLEHGTAFKDLHLVRLRMVQWVDEGVTKVGIQLHSNGRRCGWVLVEDEVNVKHLLMLLMSKVPIRAWTLQKIRWEEEGAEGFEGILMWIAEK